MYINITCMCVYICINLFRSGQYTSVFCRSQKSVLYIYVYMCMLYTYVCINMVWCYICIYIYDIHVCTYSYKYILLQPRRCIGCLFCIGRFPHKSPILSGSFANRDLHFTAVCACSQPCTEKKNLSCPSCRIWGGYRVAKTHGMP